MCDICPLFNNKRKPIVKIKYLSGVRIILSFSCKTLKYTIKEIWVFGWAYALRKIFLRRVLDQYRYPPPGGEWGVQALLRFSTVFPCTLETADAPPGVPLPDSELHTNTVSESSVKCYPVRAARRRGRVWFVMGKAERHCVACLLSWAADASEMCWSKSVVVVRREENMILCPPWGSEIRELSHRAEERGQEK